MDTSERSLTFDLLYKVSLISFFIFSVTGKGLITNQGTKACLSIAGSSAKVNWL
jgi:hypothetical protein